MERRRTPHRTVSDVMGTIHPSALSVLTPPNGLAGPLRYDMLLVPHDASLRDAASLMMRTGASMVLVADDAGYPIGLVLRRWLRPARPATRPAASTVHVLG